MDLLIHFLCCALLSYGPHAIVYYSSRLPSFSAILSVAFFYAVIQLVKFFLVATLTNVVASPLDVSSFSPYLYEFFQVLFYFVDYLPLQYLFFYYYKSIPAVQRLFYLSIGWSVASSLSFYAPSLLSAYYDMEGGYKYIEIAYYSNLNLLFFIEWITIIWIRKKIENNPDKKTLINHIIQHGAVYLLFIVIPFYSFLFHVIQNYFSIDSLTINISKGLIGIMLGIIVRQLFIYHQYPSPTAVIKSKKDK